MHLRLMFFFCCCSTYFCCCCCCCCRCCCRCRCCFKKHFSSSSNRSYSSFPSQVPCGLPSGQEAVRYFGFLPKFSSLADGEEEGDDPPSFSSLPLEEQLARMAPLLITAAFALFFFVLGAIFFLGRRQNTKRSRAR